MIKSLDLPFVRAQFPDTCFNDGWAFFENAGGSYVPNAVIDRMTAYMRGSQVQPQAPYPKSQLAGQRMADGHARMAEMIGATADEVVIGPSTSMNVYVLAQALRPLWKAGDEVIVAVANHEANSSPWRRLSEFGIVVKEWPVDAETGALRLDLLEDLLTERTRLVAFPHVSNITGDINDVPAITRQVHAAGAMVCVDAVAYAPHRAVDVKAWDVDFYLFSFYKIMGPHIGLLYGKRERLLEARGQGHLFFAEDDIQHKLNPAGPNHETIAALAGIADYFEALAAHHFDAPANTLHARTAQVFGLVAAHEQRLAERFLDAALNIPGLRLLGRRTADAALRAPTFSFTVEGKSSAEIVAALTAQQIACWNGDFYAPRLLEAVDITDTTDGVVRTSMTHYNTVEEVERLVAALDSYIARRNYKMVSDIKFVLILAAVAIVIALLVLFNRNKHLAGHMGIPVDKMPIKDQRTLRVLGWAAICVFSVLILLGSFE
ncbi:MAG TPA: cysteine desulfurase [Rhodospirillaceae bacterium]|nr:cysteine desulfurase [Magnetovibrio sp.]HCS71660.1 cysteine desulfurase [Rhodospirillaceae bacterium]|tara:strand:- start:3460 stop:4929 length:1470 start_codon:yes stop_codon:yes gene_type:complete